MSEFSLVDRNSNLPLHVQVRHRIVELIQAGSTSNTVPLPSESELMARFGVSRITVRRALNDLVAAGYVKRHAGKGSFALPRKLRHTSGRIGGASDEFKSQGFNVSAEVLDFDTREPPHDVALQMGLAVGQTARYVRRLMIVDQKPISIVRMYFNLPDAVKLTQEDVADESVIGVLRRKWAVVPVRATRTMEAAVAGDEELELLRLEPPAAILVVNMLAFDAADKGIIHVNVRYDSDLYTFSQDIEMPHE